VQANQQDVSFADLVRDTKRGIALLWGTWGTVDMDFQGRTGIVDAHNELADIATVSSVAAREIVDGQLGQAVDNVGMLLDTTRFWKNLVHVGGEKERQSVALQSTKGEPEQSVAYSVSAVPVKVTDAAIVDIRRYL
jgi:hypothetical protein